MSATEQVRIPEYLMDHIRRLAKSEGITVDQFVASAVAEKASAWATVDYLKKRGEQGSREKFLAALDKVPSVEPDPQDQLD